MNRPLRSLSMVSLFFLSLGAPVDLQAATRRILFLTNGPSPFWTAAGVGLLAGERDFKLADAGLKAVMEINDGTPKGQIDKLRQFGTQDDIAGVAVSAIDADNVAVADEMRRLRQKGVKVITVDGELNRSRLRDARAYYIGSDNSRGGKVLGLCAKHLLAAKKITKGSYAQFVGRIGSYNARERMDGFKAAVGAAFREADRMGDDFSSNKAQENVRNAMINHPDLVALVGIWSYNAPAIVTVVKERNKRQDFVIVTFDAEKRAVDQMGEGMIDAMVIQNPYQMGYETARLLKAMIQNDDATIKQMFPGKGENADVFETGLKVIVPGADSPLNAKMFDDKTEFMTLEAFRQWLAEHKLTSS